MSQSVKALRGLVVAPHHLASQAGLEVLRDGGNAIEATVAAAAAISVVYPHMNGLGGDGFWLISTPERRAPRAINAVGAAGAGVTPALYRGAGHDAIPSRGPLAANTVAGTVSGWLKALELSAELGGRLPLGRLLEPAVHYAVDGFALSDSQHRNTAAKQDELREVPGWRDLFLPDGVPPAVGARFRQPALAETLRMMAESGLDGFYRGALARRIAADLARAGSPLTAKDLAGQEAWENQPLSVRLTGGTAYNVAPPAQGLASLIILALFDRLKVAEAEGFAHVHGQVEAIKQAILVRNRHVTDPAFMTVGPGTLLADEALDALAAAIDPERALDWPVAAVPGDTVWLGAADAAGRVVSFIHSIYWEFGSGLVLRDSGIQWQNRGSSFALNEARQNALRPGRLPFHTNNPAMALLDDGRVLAYGSMGGEGQPQTQGALFSRYVQFGQGLSQAIAAPRWVLSRTWGVPREDLRLESRFAPETVEALRAAGHQVTLVGDFDDALGHAGAVVRHADGLLEGASDPRCDGQAAGF